MGDDGRDDIRRLLKEFGVRADGAIVAHLATSPGAAPLRLRFTLEDLTDYGSPAPAQRLHLEIEGYVRRQPRIPPPA